MNAVGITLGDTTDEYTNFKEKVTEELVGEDGVVD
jgi:hypothetical protein